METSNEMVRSCPFCGKEIHYRHVVEDGTDWYGHKRGSYKEYNADSTECDCEKLPFKKMCLNCKWNNNRKCVCDAIIEDLKQTISSQSPFTVNDLSPEIKDIHKKCTHWELNGHLISKYFT